MIQKGGLSNSLDDSVKNLINLPLTNKYVKVLWDENVYDPQNKYAVGDSIIVTRIDENFINTISEPEKAALAYVATYADSENCQSSDDCNGGIKCKIISILNLGCQCSNEHFAFLHKWFSPGADVFKDGHCYQRPYTAFRRLIFSTINLEVKTNILTVTYNGSGSNGESGWDFKGADIFQLKNNQLIVINSKVTIINSRKYDD